jgi:uncharacterized protein (TIGR02285 family)
MVSAMLASPAGASEGITWYQPDFPPYVIHTPAERHLGIDNQIVAFMIRHLPEFDHHYRKATYRRIMDQLKTGTNGLITPLFITEERRQFIHYSRTASYLVLPNAVIVKRTALPRFEAFIGADHRLDLEAAVRSDSGVFGISSGRSYSGIIDRVIRKYRHSESLLIRSGSDLSAGLLKMLAMDRIDAWIAFPVELRFTARHNGLDESQFAVLPVAGMEPFTPVFFGAPKTPWGRDMIRRLDAVVTRPRTIARFLDHYIYWLDEASRPAYRQMARAYYGFDPWQPVPAD